jgi:DNA-binding transcriptional MerR regulator
VLGEPRDGVEMEWSIQELARQAGTTSRTLRYYHEVGLLTPSRIGRNGYRHYDEACLVRLQRILHLRELGLGIPAIAEILAGEQDVRSALRRHVDVLEGQRRRIDRQLASVRTTLRKLEGGEALVPDEVLDGFDHTHYRDEVIERWGEDAYERGDRWWRSLDRDEQERFRIAQREIASDYADALLAGEPADGDVAQEITKRHVEWLSATTSPTKGYLLGLGELYVADPRFTRNYDRYATGTAAYVRAALAVYAELHFE